MKSEFIIIILIAALFRVTKEQRCGCGRNISQVFATPRFAFSRNCIRARLLRRRLRGQRRVPPGIGEIILAFNAFCDVNCATNQQKTNIFNCFLTGQLSQQAITQIMIGCTPNGTVSCTALRSFQNCLVRRTRGRRNIVPATLRQCFRRQLSVLTLDCLRAKYPNLSQFLPFRPLTRPRIASRKQDRAVSNKMRMKTWNYTKAINLRDFL